jgi:hypothetical protein
MPLRDMLATKARDIGAPLTFALCSACAFVVVMVSNKPVKKSLRFIPSPLSS